MKFYCVDEPYLKLLIETKPAGVEDVYAQFRNGVYDSADAGPDQHSVEAILHNRKDVFAEDDPQFADKLVASQGRLSPEVVRQAIKTQQGESAKMVYLCAWCDFQADNKEDFQAHIAAQHTRNLADVVV